MRGHGNRGIQPEEKKCSDCGQTKKTQHDFYWASGNGYSWPLKRCKECHVKYTSSRRLQNPEQYKKYDDQWRLKNPDSHKRKVKRYYLSPNGKLAKARYRNLGGPGHASTIAYSKFRRAAKKNAVTENSRLVTTEWFHQLCSESEQKCHYCLKVTTNLTQDHVIPLSRDGKHVRENIVPACISCNSSKHNKLIGEWTPEVVVSERPLELLSV